MEPYPAWPRSAKRGAALPLLLIPSLVTAGCRTSGDAEVSYSSSPSVSVAPPRDVHADDRTDVQPEAERLAADVRWLADDAREGRRAGTDGERQAAEWIAKRMAELGLEPAGEDGYVQRFTVPLPARDGGGSSIQILGGNGGDELVDGAAHLVPLFCSNGNGAEGPLAFGGFGIQAPELGWEDYGERSLAGSICLVVRGTPAVEVTTAEAGEAAANPHGASTARSAWGNYPSIFHKVMEAKRRGAAAVLVAAHPSQSDDPLLAFDAGRTAEANLPALMISAATAERLLPGYAGLVAALDAGEDVDRASAGGARLRVVADVLRETGEAQNVLGRLRGNDPQKTVVVGAHFDHLGRGGPGSLAKDAPGEIHNGADDNASGTAVTLEMARCLLAGPKPAGDVLFALWSGEELGLLGSEHWAQHPTVPLESVRANVNLDMVGRAGEGVLQVLGAGTAGPFGGWLEAAGPAAGLELKVSSSGQGLGGSDHQTFLKREIPALHLFSGTHTDYHRPSDDAEGFEAGGAEKTARLALALVREMQAPDTLAYVEPESSGEAAPRGGFRTRFGSVPEYSHEGKGLLLAGTSPGGPAERAGLLKGDLILSLDDVEIEGIGDFMYALNAHKPGDVVLVEYERDGEPREVRVTLESNQVE